MIFALIPAFATANVAHVDAKRKAECYREVACAVASGVCVCCASKRVRERERRPRSQHETQAPASITALVPIDATDSPCGIILRRNRCRFCSSSGSSSWLCGTAGRLRCCCAPGCSLGSIGGSFAQEPYIDANSMLISALVRSEHHAVVTPTVVRTFASRARTGKTERARSARKR